MTEGVLKDVFGLVRPDIGKDLKEIAANNKDFLQNRFAVAYVMSSLKDTATICGSSSSMARPFKNEFVVMRESNAFAQYSPP
jgi:hypothetical protein